MFYGAFKIDIMLHKIIIKNNKNNDVVESLLFNGEVREEFRRFDVYTSRCDVTNIVLHFEGLRLDFDIRIIGSIATITFPMSQPYYNIEFSVEDDI